MKRIIKFRAWCDKGNQMHTPCEVYAGDNGELYTRSGISTDRGYGYNIHLNIMQFTGLRDKNGVEIYEGDILIDDNYPEEGISYAVVEWVETEKYTGWLANPWGWDKEYFTDFEVVGNIHETPELLREEVPA